MSHIRRYPDAVAGPFPVPPETFVDGEGRTIEIHHFDDAGTDEQSPESEALFRMYETFDPTDRAQGIPPRKPSAIRDWLDRILTRDSVHLLAWHDDRVVGHATLVSDEGEEYELAIFVHQDYQQAGIGSHLLENLLGEAASLGIERVWLTVERWNEIAIQLYRKVGFETVGAQSFELEMGIRLAPPEGHTDNTG